MGPRRPIVSAERGHLPWVSSADRASTTSTAGSCASFMDPSRAVLVAAATCRWNRSIATPRSGLARCARPSGSIKRKNFRNPRRRPRSRSDLEAIRTPVRAPGRAELDVFAMEAVPVWDPGGRSFLQSADTCRGARCARVPVPRGPCRWNRRIATPMRPAERLDQTKHRARKHAIVQRVACTRSSAPSGRSP
jgi:hypothetical protein